MPNFRAIKISIQKALNETTRKIETLVSILKKNPHLKITIQKILEKKSRQRKFLTPPHPWKVTWLPWRLTRGHAFLELNHKFREHGPNNNEANSEIKIGTGSCIVARHEGSEKGLYASVQGECTRCTPSSACIYFSVSFVIALTICTDSRGSAAERLDNDLEYFLSSLKKGNTLVSGLVVMISTFVAVS